jgi:Proteasome/cyclosome repeat
MAPYLPQSGAVGAGSPYSEGGALYALGLIHANHGEGIKQFLHESLRNTSAEVKLFFYQLTSALCICYTKNKGQLLRYQRLINIK